MWFVCPSFLSHLWCISRWNHTLIVIAMGLVRTLEMKCLYCSWNTTSKTATENDNLKCLEHNYDEVLKPKEDNAYFYQFQAQLHICNLEFGDFVVWTPKGIQIECIYPQHDFFESTVSKVGEFYKQTVMPELLGKWYTKMPVPPASSNGVPTMVP